MPELIARDLYNYFLILITNLFRRNIPNTILEYSGDITIYSCQIMNFDGSKIRATINNNQNEQLLDKAKTIQTRAGRGVTDNPSLSKLLNNFMMR